jgi:hypothetical protein
VSYAGIAKAPSAVPAPQSADFLTLPCFSVL